MPIYDYKCPSCGKIKEALAKVDEVRKFLNCDCGKYPLAKLNHERIFNPTSTFVLKGDGWAKDNYSKPKKEKGK